ncbi:MAG: hypothetical protein ACRDQD_29940 [Nocardioidaceae bacterium]
MKLTPTLGGAYSGSIGGWTASHNKGGAYFRRRSVPTNPATEAQNEVRAIFGSLAQQWTSLLTPSQRAAWNTYASNVSWTDVLGQTIQLSGLNHYIRSNTPRVQADSVIGASSPRIDTAPVLFELGVTPQLLSSSIAHVTGPPETVVLSAAWTNGAAYTTGNEIIFIFVSPPQNPSIKFYKGPYYLMVADVADTSPLAVPLFSSAAVNRYEARFGPIETGQAVFIAARVSMDDGRLSSLAREGPILVPVAA